MRNLLLAALWAATIGLHISAVVPNLAPKPPKPPDKNEEYIARYKDLAMFEQLTTDIPASIKLGQALLESQAGESELAMNANNHFGLKCRTCSENEAYMKIDDDRNKKGELIYSKFYRFDSPEASFAAHSKHLTTETRYRSLFNNERTDYRAWAYGLKACGYATDKYYAEKLLTVIERYNLQRFDKPSLLSLSEFSPTPPQYPDDLTAANVPYNSDPNAQSHDNVQQSSAQTADDLTAVNVPYNSDPYAERIQNPRENAQNEVITRDNRDKKKMSDGKRVANNYRIESEFRTSEGEQMHFILYEVTLEGEKENVSPKNAPQKKTTILSKPVQRKKNPRVSQ